VSRQTDLTAKPAIQVAVMVLEDGNGRVLLTQRAKEKHLGGFWEFPGGKIEAGETPSDALARECQEELHYTPSSPQHILTIEHDYENVSVQLLVFHERNLKAQVTPAEQQPMQWVPTNKLTNMQLPAANAAIVSYLTNP